MNLIYTTIEDFPRNEFDRIEMQQIVFMRDDLTDIIPKGKRLTLVAHLSNLNTVLQYKYNLQAIENEEWLKMPHKIIVCVKNQKELQMVRDELKTRNVFTASLYFVENDINQYNLVYHQVSHTCFDIIKHTEKGQSWSHLPQSLGMVGICAGPIPSLLSKKILKKYPLYDI